MFKSLIRALSVNPLDALLKRAVKKNQVKFLVCWNRGLGDIPLGLYALTKRVRTFIPKAEITFLTRPNLREGFELLKDVDVLVDEEWKRGIPFDLKKTLSKFQGDFDLVIEHPDPTYWVNWQLKTLVPRLKWQICWDELHKKFQIEEGTLLIGVHVQTETHYSYQKNWCASYWKELFKKLSEKKDVKIVLFGFEKSPPFVEDYIIDLRGETTLLQALSLIKNRCDALIAPDSGILSLTYYLDVPFALKIISLWADPNQGILKQGVASPNPLLTHFPLIGKKGDIENILIDEVVDLCI